MSLLIQLLKGGRWIRRHQWRGACRRRSLSIARGPHRFFVGRFQVTQASSGCLRGTNYSRPVLAFTKWTNWLSNRMDDYLERGHTLLHVNH